MEYLTACCRQRGEGGCALLLQQYLCRRVPVCFACICTAEEDRGRETCGNMAERLLNWCRGVPWHRAAGRPDVWLERAEKELTDLIDGSRDRPNRGEDRGRGALRVTILLGIGAEILALGGGQNLSLLNTSFGRGKAAGLPGRFRGSLEPGAGLLLATDGFLKGVEGRSLEEALGLPEIKTEEQAERRLRELAAYCGKTDSQGVSSGNGISGGQPAAAILLIGRGDRDDR